VHAPREAFVLEAELVDDSVSAMICCRSVTVQGRV
jgi:hypothetical protein